MALTVQNLRDEITAQMAIRVPGFAEISDDFKDGLAEAIAEAVYNWIVGANGLPGATVTFAIGTIVGVDAPSGDTHNALTASGGTIG